MHVCVRVHMRCIAIISSSSSTHAPTPLAPLPPIRIITRYLTLQCSNNRLAAAPSHSAHRTAGFGRWGLVGTRRPPWATSITVLRPLSRFHHAAVNAALRDLFLVASDERLVGRALWLARAKRGLARGEQQRINPLREHQKHERANDAEDPQPRDHRYHIAL